ncbi:hypothetical protein [Actinoplanes derwentensis]|uniref:Uncharacterized protein n=1 Tax=Actinoplanes derwentensis TaxID=113562 RepID=A0A1H1WI06_9ACTN|nr:hypothetical protein [Actinoplanes derwentensis]GID87447.1 hypothetical protein Ade03nite_63710 [Actinoplanes derwentensis]SDS96917.1 hypothetical protein SAMN04489716_2119 [Actinoplanes derwentensis]
MTDETNEPHLRPSQKLAALLGFPEPEPFTEEEQRRYREKADRADAQLRAIIARRHRDAA